MSRSPSSLVLRWRREGEDGAVAIVVAVSLLALMGIAALAIDGGRAYVKRSNLQNAADHAALAAAWARCNGAEKLDAKAAGHASAGRNGFEDTDDRTEVRLAKDDEGWEATLEHSLETTFAQVLMFDEVTVGARAVAGCEPGGASGHDFAMFAHGEVCAADKPIEMSGSDRNYIEGDVHSNGEIHISGSNNELDGEWTYHEDWGHENSMHPSTSWDPPHPTHNPLPASHQNWPVSYDINAFDSGHPEFAFEEELDNGEYFDFGSSKIEGDELCDDGYCSGGDLLPGIYFTRGDIIMDEEGMGGEVTFVTTDGYIELDDEQFFTHYLDDGLLAFTNWHDSGDDACDNEGIQISGDDSHLVGTMYAPGSVIEISGDDNTFVGGLIALKIKINGNDNEIYAGDLGTSTDPSVNLLR